MVDIESIHITKKTRELIKLKAGLPANASNLEVNRAAHIFFIDCFIKCLQKSKKYWENERVIPMLEVLDIVDTNALIEALNELFGDKAFDLIDSMFSRNAKALKEVLTAEEFEDTEDTYFE